MLGKRSAQTSVFDSDQQYLQFVGQDSFYGYLAAHRHELFRDEDFKNLYCLGNGRTSIPPSILACALVLQWYNNVSDEEATARATYDVRWKVALGVDLMEAPFAKSVLCEFRNKLIIHKESRKLFEQSLQHARARGFFKSKNITVALDTTPIFGRGAVEDTYNLLAEGLRQVLRVLARCEDQAVEEFALEHDVRRYLAPSFKGSHAIDWDNEPQRQQVLESLVVDCNRMLHLAGATLSRYPREAPEAQAILEASSLLERLLVQDIRRAPNGNAEIFKGVATGRVISVHDPEMRHGRKSMSQPFDGYKASLAADATTQIITAVEVTGASTHDSHTAEGLIEQTEQLTAQHVQTVLGDGAYGTVEMRLSAEEHHRALIAPVPQPPNTGRFAKNEFHLDAKQTRVTCPAGQTTTHWVAGTNKTSRGRCFPRKKFAFARKQCRVCPLRSQCLGKKTDFRTVTVHEHEELLRNARAFQETALFRKQYRTRVVVEHRIARLVRLGIRNARYFGSAKVLFQIAMTAAVANLTLVAGASPIFCVLAILLIIVAITTTAKGSATPTIAPTVTTRTLTGIEHVLPRKTRGLQLSF